MYKSPAKQRKNPIVEIQTKKWEILLSRIQNHSHSKRG